MRARPEKRTVLVLDAAAKSSMPVLESCAAMGLRVIAASHKKYCCGFFSRATRERVVYPSPESHPEECLRFLLRFLQKRSIFMIFPLGHVMTAYIAKHQDALRQYTRLVLPAYEVFLTGYSKIPMLKAAEHVGCPIPQTWYPREQPLDAIARAVSYPVLIKPTIGVGARGITSCASAAELMTWFPEVEAKYGESFVQEFIPHTGTQYKCPFVLDHSQRLLAAIVYAKLRYYPVQGGSSTLNKTVHYPEILEHSVRVGQHLKWVGPCDIDWIFDPRDKTPKAMEINPRFTDTFKMTVVAGQNMTRIVYQLANGESPEPQLEYEKNRYLRFIFGDLLWFLAAKGQRWHAKPSFFDFFRSDTTYLMTGRHDLAPMIGYILENLSILWDKEARSYRLRRRHA
jgi:D-aspartate ligase